MGSERHDLLTSPVTVQHGLLCWKDHNMLNTVYAQETCPMTLIESVQTIPDFRRQQGRRSPLTALLLMTIMSMMSGRGRYREIAALAH